jgi:hypothetical protein
LRLRRKEKKKKEKEKEKEKTNMVEAAWRRWGGKWIFQSAVRFAPPLAPSRLRNRGKRKGKIIPQSGIRKRKMPLCGITETTKMPLCGIKRKRNFRFLFGFCFAKVLKAGKTRF